MTNKRSWLCLIPLLCASGSAFSGALENYSVKGIKLDMPLDEARAILKKSSPSFRQTDIKKGFGEVNGSRIRGGTPFDHGFYGYVPDVYGNHIEEYTVFGNEKPNEGKVAYVSWVMHSNKPFAYSAVRDKLVSKYGEPTFEFQPGPNATMAMSDSLYVLSWSRDIKGEPVSDLNVVKFCLGFQNGKFRDAFRIVNISSHDKFNYGNCGPTFAYMMYGSNGIVSKIYAGLVDYSRIIERNDETVALTMKLEADLKREEREKALQNAVPDL